MTYFDEEFTFTYAQLEAYFAEIKETVMSHVQVYRQPHQGSTLLDHLIDKMQFKVDAYTDGTTTEVIISDVKAKPDDGYLGRGVSRRRKGDPRRTEVGYDLALARALRNMADAIEKDAGSR